MGLTVNFALSAGNFRIMQLDALKDVLFGKIKQHVQIAEYIAISWI